MLNGAWLVLDEVQRKATQPDGSKGTDLQAPPVDQAAKIGTELAGLKSELCFRQCPVELNIAAREGGFLLQPPPCW